MQALGYGALLRWWEWILKTVQSIGLLYGLSLSLMWVMDASHNDLHMGWWFGWQVPFVMALIAPSLSVKPSWIKVRAIVLFLLTLCALACNVAFFVFRVIDFINNCDTGSTCDVLQTMFTIATLLALWQAHLCLILLWLLMRCPAFHNWHEVNRLEYPPLST